MSFSAIMSIFWCLEIITLNKFKSKGSMASNLSSYDFLTLYATLPHHPINDKSWT